MLSQIKKIALGVTCMVWASGSALAANIDLQGTIADSNGQAIGSAIVRLVKANLRDTTDNQGAFHIKGSVTNIIIQSAYSPKYTVPVMRNSTVCFSIADEKNAVSLKILDMKGRTVQRVVDREMSKGNYAVPLVKISPSAQVFIVSISIGAKTSLLKYCSIQTVPIVQQTVAGHGLAKNHDASGAVDTLIATKLGYSTLKTPITSYSTNMGMSKMASSTKRIETPNVPLHLFMTSTGSQNSHGLAKRVHATAAADTFLYPVKEWVPSKQWTGCPDYIEMTVKQIVADGVWQKAVVTKDTTKSGSDSVITKTDTVMEPGVQTLWKGSKKLRFNGSAANLSGFDSLTIPKGTIHRISVFTEPYGSVKGSITGNFIIGATRSDTATKTFYTKAAYSYDDFTHKGGSTASSVFATAPAESSSFIFNPSNDPTVGPGFQIQTTCTTQVYDSITLTMLFDISRTLFFLMADTSRFYCDAAFGGDPQGNMAILAVFPGKQGRVDGYKYLYVCNSDEGSIDADSSAPPLWSNATLGFTGWLNMVYDPKGKFLVGLGMRDNDGSFGPWGCINKYDTTARNFNMGYLAPGQGQSQIFGFKPAAALGDSCVSRVYQPSFVAGDGRTVHKRSGQAKFFLKIRQQ